eukprot:TRINITY_DN1565_c0_g1_i5.p2 TRINITY_DN1565_c0_g1~~TRINITY_DN1565_c0_g1_i5.p2  ORF type:complete len:122 (+),score=27.60 TRINITY_DN1565_c0_g1_i5:256-621(+)
MKFFQLIALFALFSCVFTERFEREDEDSFEREKEHDFGSGKSRPSKVFSEVQKYFHKKICYCISERGGLCIRLKCCDIFQYVPYQVFIRLCKGGDCKQVHKYERPVTLPAEIREKHAGVSA